MNFIEEFYYGSIDPQARSTTYHQQITDTCSISCITRNIFLLYAIHKIVVPCYNINTNRFEFYFGGSYEFEIRRESA